MPFAGSFNVQASFGGITENNIDSGTAAAGEVLTADGSGGAGWQAASGGSAQFGFSIPVTQDWANAGNAITDILLATGMQLVTNNFVRYLTLWEGSADPGDYAVLTIDETGEAVYVCDDAYGGGIQSSGFSSAPTTGTAYVVGMYAQKVT